MAAKPHLFSSKMETRILELQRLQGLESRDGQRIERTVLLHYGIACLLAPLLLSQMVTGATSAGLGIITSRCCPSMAERDRRHGDEIAIVFLHRLCKVRRGREAVQTLDC